MRLVSEFEFRKYMRIAPQMQTGWQGGRRPSIRPRRRLRDKKGLHSIHTSLESLHFPSFILLLPPPPPLFFFPFPRKFPVTNQASERAV